MRANDDKGIMSRTSKGMFLGGQGALAPTWYVFFGCYKLIFSHFLSKVTNVMSRKELDLGANLCLLPMWTGTQHCLYDCNIFQDST